MSCVSDSICELFGCIVQPIGAHGGEVMYFDCFYSRVRLGFMNCFDMCVVNKKFELLNFVLIPFMLT